MFFHFYYFPENKINFQIIIEKVDLAMHYEKVDLTMRKKPQTLQEKKHNVFLEFGTV